ncbi:MAG: hypothetical protein QS721_06740 [Candidatus Endonucleobacter sp. (ex Gigantidas childressi)]|nr:hypothetical protein [Candidatus Endonucleobacter sp. (ex Gigantidas childressi)]
MTRSMPSTSNAMSTCSSSDIILLCLWNFVKKGSTPYCTDLILVAPETMVRAPVDMDVDTSIERQLVNIDDLCGAVKQTV